MTTRSALVQFQSTTFEKVADFITSICGIKRSTVSPESHIIADLGMDSIDFLDVAFQVEKDLGIKIPYELWAQTVNAGGVTSETYFRMDGLCHHIDELVSSKMADT